jgi:hypothetical protein
MEYEQELSNGSRLNINFMLSLLSYIGYDNVMNSPAVILKREVYNFINLGRADVNEASVTSISFACINRIVYMFSLSGKKSSVMSDIVDKTENVPNLLNYMDIKTDNKTDSNLNQFEVFRNYLCTILQDNASQAKYAALEFLTLCAGSQRLFLLGFIDSNKLLFSKKINFWDNFKNFTKSNDTKLLALYAIFISVTLSDENLRKKLTNDAKSSNEISNLLTQCNTAFIKEYKTKDSLEIKIDEDIDEFELEIEEYYLNNSAINAITNIYIKLILNSSPKNQFNSYKQLNEFIKHTVSAFLNKYQNEVDNSDVLQYCEKAREGLIITDLENNLQILIKQPNKTLYYDSSYYLKVFDTLSSLNYSPNFWINMKELFIYSRVDSLYIEYQRQIFIHNLMLSLYESKVQCMYSIKYALKIIFSAGLKNALYSNVLFLEQNLPSSIASDSFTDQFLKTRHNAYPILGFNFVSGFDSVKDCFGFINENIIKKIQFGGGRNNYYDLYLFSRYFILGDACDFIQAVNVQNKANFSFSNIHDLYKNVLNYFERDLNWMFDNPNFEYDNQLLQTFTFFHLTLEFLYSTGFNFDNKTVDKISINF